MERDTQELLEGIIVYARLLDSVNKKFAELITQNTEKEMHENEQLFYEVISEILRVYPLEKRNGEIKGIDMKSGILLLQADIPFLLEEYNRILEEEKYKKILVEMMDVRNKFIHEPHNMHACYYVGGKTSCTVGVYYETILCSLSTIKISYIVYELNKVFIKLRKYVLDDIDKYDEKYKEYPCYIALLKCDFEQYNKDYPMMPIWMLHDDEETDWEKALEDIKQDSED